MRQPTKKKREETENAPSEDRRIIIIIQKNATTNKEEAIGRHQPRNERRHANDTTARSPALLLPSRVTKKLARKRRAALHIYPTALSQYILRIRRDNCTQTIPMKADNEIKGL